MRKLVFGPAQQFERFLGAYVAAFHLEKHPFDIGRALKLHEETDRVGAFYPLDGHRMDATYAFRHDDVDVPHEQRLDFVRQEFKGAGWILEQLLDQYQRQRSDLLQFHDADRHARVVSRAAWRCSATPAAASLSLAGQGSHMAMAGAYVLSRELARHGGDHEAAFAAYQAFLKPAVDRRQADAALFAKVFIPSSRSLPWLRRLDHPADVQFTRCSRSCCAGSGAKACWRTTRHRERGASGGRHARLVARERDMARSKKKQADDPNSPPATSAPGPAPIVAVTTDYERWLHKRVDVVEADIEAKHKQMTGSLFAFLRATFYRWASLWPEVCPDLAKAPRVLAVGDLHVENFGTWRDSEGRLVWGVNDFDEVANMPYAVDLVRLVTSVILAKHENELAIDAGERCDGRARGLCGSAGGGRQSLHSRRKPPGLARNGPWCGAQSRSFLAQAHQARPRDAA